MDTKDFIQTLKQDIDEKSILKHPFYQMWNEGKLEIADLREYSAQYFKIVNTWPQWISSAHSKCDDQNTRELLVRNLMEEELGTNAGNKPHSEMWSQFSQALGIKKEDLANISAFKETNATLQIFNNNIRNKSFLEAVGALYAYEAQVPQVAATKMHGLNKFYNMNDNNSTEFFKIHSIVDVKHAKVWENIIEQFATDMETQANIRQSLNEALDAQLLFLDGVQRMMTTPTHAC